MKKRILVCLILGVGVLHTVQINTVIDRLPNDLDIVGKEILCIYNDMDYGYGTIEKFDMKSNNYCFGDQYDAFVCVDAKKCFFK